MSPNAPYIAPHDKRKCGLLYKSPIPTELIFASGSTTKSLVRGWSGAENRAMPPPLFGVIYGLPSRIRYHRRTAKSAFNLVSSMRPRHIHTHMHTSAVCITYIGNATRSISAYKMVHFSSHLLLWPNTKETFVWWRIVTRTISPRKAYT